MIKKLSILIFVLIALVYQTSVQAQKSWDKELLQKANTAKDIAYLTEEEKQIVFYTNLLRLNPALFKDTFLKRYIDSTGSKSSYVKSLLKTLQNTGSLPVLIPSASLYQIAKEHAIIFGKQGKMGHGNYKKRTQKYVEKCECMIGENCYYGNIAALETVISLLIDENISDLAHRKNLLNPAFIKIGVYISQHKTYKKSSVMDYSAAAAD